MRRSALGLVLVAAHGLGAPPETADGESGLDPLMKLLNTPVLVASHTPISARRSPGILTVIQRPEIQASGARDLLELLRFVPGIEFASDSQGVVGIGMRTAWAHDGKVLLLIDGQEMNEPGYATMQFGGHYPVEAIQRIEVIRGPGSVIYGGYAELAVINVITRSGADLEGVAGSLTLGETDGSLLRRGAHVAWGHTWGKTDVSFSYSGGRAGQGDGPWTLASGTALSAEDESRLNTDFLNLGLTSENFGFRFIRDGYNLRDYTREFRPTSEKLSFLGEFLELNYRWEASPDWTLRPRLNLKRQTPWFYASLGTSQVTRSTGSLTAEWDSASPLRIVTAVEATHDLSSAYQRPAGWSGQDIIYDNRSFALEGIWSADWGDLNLGGRMDNHSEFGTVWSPRFAFTKATDQFHFKLLAARAFRAPAIENLLVNPALKPEHTATYEAELGWSLGPGVYASMNAFILKIRDPISYVNPAPNVDFYANFDHTGSRGLEISLQATGTKGWVRSSLSLSEAQDHDAPFYQVTRKPDYHVGFANLKFASQAQWRPSPNWAINPSLLVLGPRYAYQPGGLQATRMKTTSLLNLWLTWNPGGEKTELGLGTNNLLNAANTYPQAYGVPGAGGNPPLPASGRELTIRATYNF